MVLRALNSQTPGSVGFKEHFSEQLRINGGIGQTSPINRLGLGISSASLKSD